VDLIPTTTGANLIRPDEEFVLLSLQQFLYLVTTQVVRFTVIRFVVQRFTVGWVMFIF
jgi:hypothetical protein